MNAIERVVESLGGVVPYGSGWRKMRCPFHDDRSPSASVNITLGRFHCFTCGINEDAIGLLMSQRGLTYAEAKQETAADADSGDGGIRDDNHPSGTLFDRPWDRRKGGKKVPSRGGRQRGERA